MAFNIDRVYPIATALYGLATTSVHCTAEVTALEGRLWRIECFVQYARRDLDHSFSFFGGGSIQTKWKQHE